MIAKRIVLLYSFISVIILFVSVRTSSAQEVVLYASQAPVKVGNWYAASDSTAAGGARISNPDFGAAKILTPLANPADYFEMSFNASAGTPYRLWIRGRTLNNSPYNDSVYAQFSGSVDSGGHWHEVLTGPVGRGATVAAAAGVVWVASGIGTAAMIRRSSDGGS